MSQLNVHDNATLAAALKAAVDGDTIVFGPGVYLAPPFEGVKKAITLQPLAGAKAKLFGARLDNSSGLHFKGLTMLPSMALSVCGYAPGLQDATFEDVDFEGAGSGLALDIRGGARITIIRGSVAGLEAGFKLSQGTHAVNITGVDLSHLGADGVDINSCQSVRIANCYFHDMRMLQGAHPDGVQVDNARATMASRDILVEDCLFAQNAGTRFEAVFASKNGPAGLQNFNIRRNVVLGAMPNGIFPSFGSGEISSNFVAGVGADSYIRAYGAYDIHGNECQAGSMVDWAKNTQIGQLTAAEMQARVASWLVSWKR